MCLFPRLIKNKKFTPTKKNGGVVPPVIDKRTLFVPVGCGKCIECKKQKARDWQIRIIEEIKKDTSGKFVTLTLSNEEYRKLNIEIDDNIKGYDRDNEIATKATRRFLERWRASKGKSVKHWFVTEIGGNGTENIHIHGIVWCDNEDDIKKYWKYGYTFVGTEVSERTASYITKYITKTDEKHNNYSSKVLTSKGIGSGYLKTFNAKNNKYKKCETNETYRTPSGKTIALGTYYRNKIYSEEEREKLWIEKLDNNKRYVLGTEIDLNNNLEEYERALREARRTNARLGYGDNSKNWSKEEYENQRREMMQAKRLME